MPVTTAPRDPDQELVLRLEANADDAWDLSHGALHLPEPSESPPLRHPSARCQPHHQPRRPQPTFTAPDLQRYTAALAAHTI